MASFFLISDLHVDHYISGIATENKIKKVYEKVLLPTETLLIAGDIATDEDTIITTLETFSTMYKFVYWCPGNHDMAISHSNRFKDSETKMLYIAMNTLHLNNVFMLTSFLKCDMLQYSKVRITLKNTETDKRTFMDIVGNFGGYDASYGYQHLKDFPNWSQEKFLNNWKNWYDTIHCKFPFENPLEYQKFLYGVLNKNINNNTKIVMTHCGPKAFDIPEKYNNKFTNFFYFDGKELLEKMPMNSFWCFGHTHEQKILQLENVKLMCNPFGYPNEVKQVIPKEQFIIEV